MRREAIDVRPKEEAAAHAGVVRAPPDATCASCHGEAASSLAARYAKDAGAAVAAPPRRSSPHGQPVPNAILAGFGLAFGAVGLAWLRHRSRAAARSAA